MASAIKNEYFLINGKWGLNINAENNQIVEVDSLENLKLRYPAKNDGANTRTYEGNLMTETKPLNNEQHASFKITLEYIDA